MRLLSGHLGLLLGSHFSNTFSDLLFLLTGLRELLFRCGNKILRNGVEFLLHHRIMRQGLFQFGQQVLRRLLRELRELFRPGVLRVELRFHSGLLLRRAQSSPTFLDVRLIRLGEMLRQLV